MGVLQRSDDRMVIRVGRLDASSVPDVRIELYSAIDSGTGALALDLSAADIVDATGLGLLVSAHRRAGRVGRTLVLCDVPTRLGRLLRVTRLDRVLHVDSVPSFA